LKNVEPICAGHGKFSAKPGDDMSSSESFFPGPREQPGGYIRQILRIFGFEERSEEKTFYDIVQLFGRTHHRATQDFGGTEKSYR
jgi:hypothetical protein